MTQLDSGRLYDLEDIAKALKRSKSRAETEFYEKIMWQILGESQPIRALRVDLIAAMRTGDMRVVKRIEQHIQQIRRDETYGQSWGQDKGNKRVN